MLRAAPLFRDPAYGPDSSYKHRSAIELYQRSRCKRVCNREFYQRSRCFGHLYREIFWDSCVFATFLQFFLTFLRLISFFGDFLFSFCKFYFRTLTARSFDSREIPPPEMGEMGGCPCTLRIHAQPPSLPLHHFVGGIARLTKR